jgi:hypothetical protein
MNVLVNILRSLLNISGLLLIIACKSSFLFAIKPPGWMMFSLATGIATGICLPFKTSPELAGNICSFAAVFAALWILYFAGLAMFLVAVSIGQIAKSYKKDKAELSLS